MPTIKKLEIPPLDLSRSRPISPGCPSAGDYEMGSPRSWCSSLVLPDRPRTSDQASFSGTRLPENIPSSAWRIMPGSYVAFCLDVKGLANHHPPGSKKSRTLLKFCGSRFIGLVVKSNVSKNDEGNLVEDLAVLFVGAAPPSLPDAFEFFVPIAPFNVPGVDLQERPPIKTKEMFPMSDMVQWTTFGTRLQIETFVESSLAFRIDDDEFTVVEDIIAEDMARLAQLPQSEIINKLRVPEEALPAQVWRDIRGGHKTDPAEFMVEVWGLVEELGPPEDE